MKYSIFFRDSTHILLTRDFISMMKEVPLYHQMNGGIHMNQLVTGKFMRKHPHNKPESPVCGNMQQETAEEYKHFKERFNKIL